MKLNEKIREIADDYGAFTRKAPGWEAYLSIKEYGQLREMARNEINYGTSGSYGELPAGREDTSIEYMRPAAEEKETRIVTEKETAIDKRDNPGTKTESKPVSKEELELQILLGIKEE